MRISNVDCKIKYVKLQNINYSFKSQDKLRGHYCKIQNSDWIFTDFFVFPLLSDHVGIFLVTSGTINVTILKTWLFLFNLTDLRIRPIKLPVFEFNIQVCFFSLIFFFRKKILLHKLRRQHMHSSQR